MGRHSVIATAEAPRDIRVRAAWPEDQAYVAATLADQLERGGHVGVNSSAGFVGLVDQIIDSPTTRVLVATEHHRIVGWLAYAAIPRVRAILFAYVRRHDRMQGVARKLADAAWPTGKGQWVHGGLRGGSTKALLQRYAAIEMPLGDLL